ncbi:MAG: TFIIB-type zinc ribbon-containing protein [Armatimonadota bacterium]
MNCPVCGARLREIQKYGVEVDICPDCKGVWLDRGELEKVLELEAAGGPTAEPAPARERQPRAEERSEAPRERPYREDDERRYDDRDRQYDDRRGHPQRKRRGSWLGELFEGFGGDD